MSYIYTDRGRDYLSHHWDGSVVELHKQAIRLEGGLELLRVQRRVGLLDELTVRHLLARGRNAKEKPVERVHKVISQWEQNTFAEYCGPTPGMRPDRWNDLYARHHHLAPERRPNESPFIRLDQYRDALGGFIVEYNLTGHERMVLGGVKIVPIEEYKRLYTTRYEISRETLVLLLMKADKRTIRKNGIQCFQKHWFYYHESMAEFKGCDVEVRYSDGDYGRVWVVLPDSRICEAQLITPTPLLNLTQSLDVSA